MFNLVIETYTTDTPAPHDPQGPDGEVTLRISDNNPGGGGAKYDTAKAEAIIPQLPYSHWDMGRRKTDD